MIAEKCRQITVRLEPEHIELVRDCDAVQLRMESTTGETVSSMWLYTDKFLKKLGYE